MKLATWNVNGIRARQGEVRQWIERERPDIVCLQEIKATSGQVPAALCDMEGYWCHWHGDRAYSGVGLHVSQAFSADRPAFAHPDFDYENRIVTVTIGDLTVASVYVPNGGKDFSAKMQFLEAMDAYAISFQSSQRPLVLLGDMNVARAERDVHPKERKPRAIGQLPEERAIMERILSRGLVDVGRTIDPDNEDCSHGGHPGEICASGISAGGSITCSRARRSHRARSRARYRRMSVRAITRRWLSRSEMAKRPLAPLGRNTKKTSRRLC
jgi:exodeoxyribonuclease-3